MELPKGAKAAGGRGVEPSDTKGGGKKGTEALLAIKGKMALKGKMKGKGKLSTIPEDGSGKGLASDGATATTTGKGAGSTTSSPAELPASVPPAASES